MTDLENPTNQFHSYQPPTAIPQGSRMKTPWRLLKKVGLEDSKIDSLRLRMESVDLEESWKRARTYARRNRGKILGGLALLGLGIALLSKKPKSKIENPKSLEHG